MEIKNKTAYTFDTLLKFQRRHGRGITLTMTILVCISAWILLCSLGFSLLWFALGLAEAPELGNILYTAFYLVLCLVYVVFIPLFRRYIAHKQAKRQTQVEYVFTEDHFIQTSTSDTLNGYVECKYDMLVRVKESKHAFYLYTNARTALIVSKDGFTEGNEEELRLLLRMVIEPKKLRIK